MKLPPFQAVFEAQRTDVYRFLLATAGPADADDCFQETWISALRAYPRLRRADNIRGWLLKIAQNKAIDAHRARARRPVPVETAAGHGGRAPDQPAAVEHDDELWEAVRSLPAKAAHGGLLPLGARHALRRAGRAARIAPKRRRAATCTKA